MKRWNWRGYCFLLCALSMSLGWRIRGQLGHEIGAAIPGALGAIALVLAAGREDWRRRVHYFALFGAMGWSFGGSMSYMKVVSFCHSSDSATVLYGFAGMFLLGFLWSALGGAGVALPATLDASRLAGLFPALAAVFVAWFLQDIGLDLLRGGKDSLDWFDTDWIGAAVAVAAALLLALVRRRVDLGVSLVLHLGLGWWTAFLVLVVGLGLRLNPPRGDNWAGCVGLVGGLLVFCRRYALANVARAALVTGFLGGIGFALAQMIKLALIAAGLQSNTHVIMEWLHGAFFGLALAAAFLPLACSEEELNPEQLPRWTQIVALLFLLLVIPYYNFVKCPEQWTRNLKTLTLDRHGLPLVAKLLPSGGWIGWVDLVFIVLGGVLLALLIRQQRRPSPLLPANWHGRGQMLYLVFVWASTFISFARDVTGFGSGTVLIIQWAITLHALLCTVLVLWPALPAITPRSERHVTTARWRIGTILALGLVAAMVTSFAGWGLKRSLFGDTFPGHFYMNHIRFGPNNTNDKK